MKHFLLKTVLLLFALIVGSSAWGQTYKLVTSSSDLSEGDVILITNAKENGSAYALGTTQNTNNRKAESVSISSNIISTLGNAQEITLESKNSNGYFTFKVGANSYLYAANSSTGSSNYLKSKNDNAIYWSISFTANTNVAAITDQTSSCNGRNKMKYNANNNNPIFSCYSSADNNLFVFKKAYTVTYDANGGTGTMTDTNSPYFGGSTVTVQSNSFTRKGYTFNGWNTKANGSGTPYAAGATFDISENTTLYAQWVAAGDYVNATPNSADISVSGDVAEFTLSTNLENPSYAIKYYTTAAGDVEASKPNWLGNVEFAGSTLDIVVNENTGAARTAYFKVYSGETYSDVITISQAAYVAVTSVTLDIKSKTLLVNGTVTLEATVNPDNASYKTVTWESSDDDVATVDDGEVTAIAAGTAIITVKSTDDPTKKATCTITVTDGSINLDATGEIEITSFPSFSGSGYKTANPYTIGDYDWVATNCMLGDGNLQLKASVGNIVSPTIKSTKGFTVTVTVPTNSVTVSDGTNSASTSNGVATLTTTKTSTTITIAAGSSYAQISKIKITPSKDPVATEVSITDPGTLAKDATGTFAYTATTEEANTASWTSATTDVITITDAATGAYTAAGRGTSKITLTLTPNDATTYGTVTAERTISVSAPVVITASNVAMTYGDAAKSIGATTSAGYSGTLSYASGNTNIATVDATGKVTALAAGTTTITISAPADAEHLYTAGDDKVINVTVSAPAGGTTAPSAATKTIVDLSLKDSSLPTGWTQTSTNNSWNAWSASSSNGAVGTAYDNGTRYAGTYDLITSEIDLTGYASARVIFKHAGNYFGTPSDEAKLYVKVGDAAPVQLTINTHLVNGWSDYTNTTDLTDYAGKQIKLIFRYISDGTSNHCGTWDIKTFQIKGEASNTTSVTLNKYGYATYCSQYPIDFSKATGCTAWRVSSIDASGNITFTKITEAIKGGQGVLLYNKDADGVNTSVATLTFADGDVEFNKGEAGTNLFVGTTVATNVKANEVYGLSGNKFVKSSAGGNIPAGKAYILASSIPSSAKSFNFIFDDETTGISEMKTGILDNEAWYDLQGRRVAQPTKGIYIHNGKKVFVK